MSELRRRTLVGDTIHGRRRPQCQIAGVRVLDRSHDGIHLKIMTVAGDRRSAWVSQGLLDDPRPGPRALFEGVVSLDGGPTLGPLAPEILELLRSAPATRGGGTQSEASLEVEPRADAGEESFWVTWLALHPQTVTLMVLGIAAMGALFITLLAAASALLVR